MKDVIYIHTVFNVSAFSITFRVSQLIKEPLSYELQYMPSCPCQKREEERGRGIERGPELGLLCPLICSFIIPCS
jgi:hypothetical protein